jgi:hypothetical protein
MHPCSEVPASVLKHTAEQYGSWRHGADSALRLISTVESVEEVPRPIFV